MSSSLLGLSKVMGFLISIDLILNVSLSEITRDVKDAYDNTSVTDLSKVNSASTFPTVLELNELDSRPFASPERVALTLVMLLLIVVGAPAGKLIDGVFTLVRSSGKSPYDSSALKMPSLSLSLSKLSITPS
ncbi:MAG: Uncharacterised protein [Bacteroidota bacterium]|nr:MAG: Uncharacterised protein [Bacteroidota bacterium]